MALKNFIYLSKLKVDMLFDQLPEARVARLATEIKADLKVIGTSQTEEETFESRPARLELVVSALQADDAIGDLDHPSTYVAGEIDMAWGLMEPGRSDPPGTEPAAEEFLLFAGSPDGRRVVGLVGSRAHLMGQEGASIYAYYTRPSTLRLISEGMRGDQAASTDNAREYEMFSAGVAAHRMALEYPAEDKQRVEFIARTYRLDDRGVLLGSPLYVALADEQSQEQHRDGLDGRGHGTPRARRRWRLRGR